MLSKCFYNRRNNRKANHLHQGVDDNGYELETNVNDQNGDYAYATVDRNAYDQGELTTNPEPGAARNITMPSEAAPASGSQQNDMTYAVVDKKNHRPSITKKVDEDVVLAENEDYVFSVNVGGQNIESGSVNQEVVLAENDTYVTGV